MFVPRPGPFGKTVSADFTRRRRGLRCLKTNKPCRSSGSYPWARGAHQNQQDHVCQFNISTTHTHLKTQRRFRPRTVTGIRQETTPTQRIARNTVKGQHLWMQGGQSGEESGSALGRGGANQLKPAGHDCAVKALHQRLSGGSPGKTDVLRMHDQDFFSEDQRRRRVRRFHRV